MLQIIVKNKTNAYWFDLFVEKLESEAPIEMQTVEDHLNLDVENADEIISEASDTLSMFKLYIKQLELDESKKKNVEIEIMSLYNESLLRSSRQILEISRGSMS